MNRKILSSLLVARLTVCVFAISPGALTNAVQNIMPNILGAEHGCPFLMRDAVEANGWTPDDCSDILLAAQDTLRTSDAPYSSYRRMNALGLIGDFGSTNCLNRLAALVSAETGGVKERAAVSFLLLSRAEPTMTGVITAEMDKSPDFSVAMYRRIDSMLSHFNGDSELRKNLLRLLLERVGSETCFHAGLDDILCREIPKWRGSVQRAENAGHMARRHAAAPSLALFFESVKANAISTAVATANIDPHGTSQKRTGVSERASAGNGGSTTGAIPVVSDESLDRWADLLDALPEKTPWAPPPGAPRPF